MAHPLRQSRSRSRIRNPNIVRMFGLRNIEVPHHFGQQAAIQHKNSRIRRRAGHKAWATRLARYGPTGRTTATPRHMQPMVVIPQRQPSSDDPPLAYDEAPHIASRLQVAGMREHLDASSHHSIIGESEAFAVYEDEAPRRPDEPPHVPYFSPIPPLSGMRLPSVDPVSPIPEGATVGEPASPMGAAPTQLIAPQGVIPNPRLATEFTIFSDSASAEDDGSVDPPSGFEANKENRRPDWHGRPPPRAPGARRISPPIAPVAETREQRQEETRPIGIAERFVRFFGE